VGNCPIPTTATEKIWASQKRQGPQSSSGPQTPQQKGRQGKLRQTIAKESKKRSKKENRRSRDNTKGDVRKTKGGDRKNQKSKKLSAFEESSSRRKNGAVKGRLGGGSKLELRKNRCPKAVRTPQPRCSRKRGKGSMTRMECEKELKPLVTYLQASRERKTNSKKKNQKYQKAEKKSNIEGISNREKKERVEGNSRGCIFLQILEGSVKQA